MLKHPTSGVRRYSLSIMITYRSKLPAASAHAALKINYSRKIFYERVA